MTDQTPDSKSKGLKTFPLVRKVVLLVFLVIYWIIFNYCDPFGIKDGTEEGSTRVFHALSIPGYGIGSRETHKHVAVVTVNDQTFNDPGSVFASQRWPLSYTSQNSILMKILAAKPAALFVDVRFIYPSSNQKGDISLDQAFGPVIDQARKNHIPIAFARGDGGLEEEKDDASAEKAHGKDGEKPKQDKGEDKEFVFKQVDLPGVLKSVQVFSNGDSEEAHYPLVKEVKEKGKPKQFVFLNPALKLYDQLCNPQWKTPAGDFAAPEGSIAPLCKDYNIETYKAPLIVKWGLVRDPYQRFVSKVDKEQQGLDQRLVAHFWSRAVLDLKRGLVAVSDKLSAVIPDADRGVEKKNYYPLTISAQQLFCDVDEDEVCATRSYDQARSEKECEGAGDKGSSTPGARDNTTNLCEDPKHPLIKDYLKDRVVFYGTDLRDEHDDEDVSAIGRIPGVVVHAMAFDNLMTYGHLYYHVYGRYVLGIPILKWFNLGVWLILAVYMVFTTGERVKLPWVARKKDAIVAKLHWLIGVKDFPCFRSMRQSLARFWWGDIGAPGRRVCRPRKGMRRGLPLALGLIVGGVGYILHDPVEGAAFLGVIVGGYFLLLFNVEKGFCRDVMLIGMIEGLIFQLNTSWLRWGNTDWISLAVLWTAAQQGEFAENMESVVGKGGQQARKIFFAVHGEKLLEWSNRARHMLPWGKGHGNMQ